MNRTVVQLTAKSLLGRKRALLLVLLSLLILGLAGVFRAVIGRDDEIVVHFLDHFALGAIVPLICLIAGTGSIGTEIDDGSIVYLLAKPLRRRTIVASKLFVAIGSSLMFAVLPVIAAALMLSETSTGKVTLAYALGTAAAAVVYSALFFLLAIVTRHASIVGFLYAVVWETTVAGSVPGARALSVRQWSSSIVERVLGTDLARTLNFESAVSFGAGTVLLTLAFVASTAYAVKRLQTIRLTVNE